MAIWSVSIRACVLNQRNNYSLELLRTGRYGLIYGSVLAIDGLCVSQQRTTLVAPPAFAPVVCANAMEGLDMADEMMDQLGDELMN